MKHNLEKLYYYSASLLSLLVIIVLLILIAGSIVDYIIPPNYNRFEGLNENAIREEIVFQKYGPNLSEKELKQKKSSITQKEIEDFKKKQLELQRKDILRSLLKELISLALVSPIYIFHFLKARKISEKDFSLKENLKS